MRVRKKIANFVSLEREPVAASHSDNIQNQMKRRFPVALSVAALLGVAAVVASGCRRDSQKAVQDDILVAVADSVLTLQDVVGRIPPGLESEDSIRLFNSIVDTWIGDMLLTDMAEANIPDMEKIDRLVNDYRRRLILGEYRRLLKSDYRRKASEDEIRRYYEAHADDMRLEHPVVKGIYIKLASDAVQLASVREWVFSATRESIDKLEKFGLRDAVQYDYFADRWIDWNEIAQQIPFRFGDSDQFVATTRNFETTHQGATYFLHISEFLKSGDVMPFSFASPQIEEMLLASGRAESDRRMMESLFRKALADGTLRPVGFDPVRHAPIEKKDKQ